MFEVETIFVAVPTPEIVHATTRIQRWYRNTNSRRRTLASVASVARKARIIRSRVVTIQRMYRQHMSRKWELESADTRSAPVAPPPSLASSPTASRDVPEWEVIKIQAIWRGYRTRSRLHVASTIRKLEALLEKDSKYLPLDDSKYKDNAYSMRNDSITIRDA